MKAPTCENVNAVEGESLPGTTADGGGGSLSKQQPRGVFPRVQLIGCTEAMAAMAEGLGPA